MAITTEHIKELREETGVSIMQCKKALEEAEGDMEKAKIILRKSSSAVAAKKSGRLLGSGVAQAYVHAGNTVVGAVVLACETDFVAKNEEFVKLAYDIAMHVAAMSPSFISRADVDDADVVSAREVFEKEASDKSEDVRAKIVEGKMNSFLSERVLLEQPFVKNPEVTIHALIDAATQKFGEKIEVTRMERLTV
jgi:elongation factor Ts